MLLETKNLHVELDSESGLVHAVDGVRLAIAKGQTFAVVGESGCGKSMTALALMRLLPDNGRITAGQILLDGRDLNALPESAMRSERGGRIGIIFQEPATSLNPVLRVGDQIVETIQTHTELRGAAAKAKALEWLNRVGIPNAERRIDDYSFQLSGGQKQRVMIAIALAAEPDILIADEPTTALDVTIQAQILDLLKHLQESLGMAMLLITHDLAVVKQMAHHVALMYAGEVVELASADVFFSKPLHPYAQKLFDALPDASKRGGNLAAIAGTVPALNREFSECRFADRCDYVHAACRSAPPELLESTIGHWVRCVLHLPGAPSPVQIEREALAAPSTMQAAGSGDVLLEVRDLKVHYPIRQGVLRRVVDHVRAVDGVSFTVHAGRTLALVGESGCGKTTTGKALLQLLRDNATITGDVRLQGMELGAVTGSALHTMRQKVQIIFQDPFGSLNPRMRVREILEEGLITLRPDLPAEARREVIERITRRVSLRPDALDRFPHEFSGGQRQRIAIARALAVEPRLIVCDEPTSALDVSVQAQILNLLKELQQEMGIAFLFITHNIGVVEFFAHDVAVMQRGLIVEQGPAEQVLGSPQHEYTKTLLAAVPRI
jgi:peptide/nickel transport system ATP-binding protein